MRVATHIVGGLGNQMFAYAAGRALAQRCGGRIELRTEFYLGRVPFGREFLLDRFRGPRQAAKCSSPRSFRLVLALARRLPSAFPSFVIEQEPASFEPRAFGCLRRRGLVHVVGHWQSERYFEDLRAPLLADFEFAQPPAETVRAVAQLIEAETDPVAVHLRAYTDIPDPRERRVLDWNYVTAACSRIRAAFPRARLFLFADDPGRFREAARSLGAHHWIDATMGLGAHGACDDLYLMSRCKHFVVANSSFSWWGAWLSQQRWGLTDGRSAGARIICAPAIGVFNADFVPRWWCSIDEAGQMRRSTDCRSERPEMADSSMLRPGRTSAARTSSHA